MLHDITLYLFFGTSYSFGMYQLNKMLNNTELSVRLKPYNTVELIILALFWPIFLLIFIVSFFKS
jgi:hypothetical protein